MFNKLWRTVQVMNWYHKYGKQLIFSMFDLTYNDTILKLCLVFSVIHFEECYLVAEKLIDKMK